MSNADPIFEPPSAAAMPLAHDDTGEALSPTIFVWHRAFRALSSQLTGNEFKFIFALSTHVDGKTFETYVTAAKIAGEVGEKNIGRVRAALGKAERLGLCRTIRKSNGGFSKARVLTVQVGTKCVPVVRPSSGTKAEPVESTSTGTGFVSEPRQNLSANRDATCIATGTESVPQSTQASPPLPTHDQHKAAALRAAALEAASPGLFGIDDTSKPKPRVKPAADVGMPPALATPEFQRSWQEWLEYLNKRRHRPSPTSAEKQLSLLANFGPSAAIDAINMAIARGWKSLHPKNKESHGLNKTRTREFGEPHLDLTRAVVN